MRERWPQPIPGHMIPPPVTRLSSTSIPTTSPEWFASQASRFDAYPRCGAGVYFGEYSANGYFAGQPQTEQGANTWKSALGEAAFLTGCERNSDVVRMTSYAPLLAHIPAKGWAQNLIEFNPAHVNPHGEL